MSNTTVIAARNRFEAARALVEWFPLSLILLGARFSVGAVFFNSGLLKYNSWEFAIKLFEDEYKVPLLDPAIAARLAMFNELVFPVFLFIGLATRLATLPLLGMTFVIEVFVYPMAWPEHLMWASLLVLVLTRGPGVFSIDHLIEQRFRKTL